MKVVVREAAARDLDHILDWITKDSRVPRPNWCGGFLTASTGLQFPVWLTSGGRVWSKVHANFVEAPYIVVYMCSYDEGLTSLTKKQVVIGDDRHWRIANFLKVSDLIFNALRAVFVLEFLYYFSPILKMQ